MAGKTTGTPNQLRCSFCNKSQEQVRKLIAGNGVYICDDYWESVSEVGHDVVREYSLKNTHSDGENAKNDAQGGV